MIDAGARERFLETATKLRATLNGRGSSMLDVLGNGRFASSICERAQHRAASRLAGAELLTLTDLDLLLLTTDDVNGAIDELIRTFKIDLAVS